MTLALIGVSPLTMLYVPIRITKKQAIVQKRVEDSRDEPSTKRDESTDNVVRTGFELSKDEGTVQLRQWMRVHTTMTIS